MDKEEIINLIKGRIEVECRKHAKLDWPRIAAGKIYTEWFEYFDNEIKEFPALERVIALYESQIKRREFRSMPVGVGPRYGDNETLDVPKWLAKHGREIIGKTISDDAVRWHIECPNIAMHTTANAWRDCCVTQKDDGTLGGHCLHQSCGMSNWPSLRDAIGSLDFSDYHEPIVEGDDVDLSGFMASVPVDRDCKKKQCLEFPVECLDVPGLVGEIMAYNAKTAIYPRTELQLGERHDNLLLVAIIQRHATYVIGA